MGPVYDQPRDTLTREQVDASLRYQIMEIVDQIRWIPEFGYDRELDWLRNMHDWMISKKRYWGLALPIYDCAACGTVEVDRGPRRAARARGRGLGPVRGPHPAPAVGRRGQDRLPVRAARRSSGSRTSAIRGSTPGSCPSRRSTSARSPSTGPMVPGRLHHRELPRPVPQLVLLDAGDVDGPPPRAAVQDDLRLRPGLRRGRPADAQELGQRDRLRRGRRADGRRRHALDVREGATRGEHPLRLARGRRGAPRAADPVERVRVLRDVRATRRLDAGEPGARRSCERPVLDRWILSRAAGTAADRRGRGSRDVDARRRDARAVDVHRRPLDVVPAPVAGGASRGADDTADRAAAFATLHEALVALPGCWRRSCRSSPTRCTRTSCRRVDPDAPDSVHLTRWPAEELAGLATSRSRRRWRSPGARSSWRARCAAQAGLKTRQPLARAVARAARGDWRASRDALLDLDRVDEINVKAVELIGDELRARRAPGQAAAAEDRQAARRGDPGDDGGRPRWATFEFHADGSRDRWRRDARAGRGRDPGHAATGHGGRPGRRARARASTPS